MLGVHLSLQLTGFLSPVCVNSESRGLSVKSRAGGLRDLPGQVFFATSDPLVRVTSERTAYSGIAPGEISQPRGVRADFRGLPPHPLTPQEMAVLAPMRISQLVAAHYGLLGTHLRQRLSFWPPVSPRTLSAQEVSRGRNVGRLIEDSPIGCVSDCRPPR